jgi:hypothetical protein
MAFDLKSIRRGKSVHAPRIFLYSTHGIGKSTFAAGAPDPIFICTEDGLGSIDTASFPLAKSSDDVLSAIKTLYTEDHNYKSVVLDSADWLEAILQREIETKHDAKELAFGKGALILAEKWREILEGLNALRNDKNMIVVIIGHTEIKRFDSPEVEPFDRYQPKLQARASALVQEWADAVLFANFRTIVKKDDVGFNKTVARGITTGERLLYTAETPAYLAKNRYGLPAVLPLSWDAFSDALTASAS